MINHKSPKIMLYNDPTPIKHFQIVQCNNITSCLMISGQSLDRVTGGSYYLGSWEFFYSRIEQPTWRLSVSMFIIVFNFAEGNYFAQDFKDTSLPQM